MLLWDVFDLCLGRSGVLVVATPSDLVICFGTEWRVIVLKTILFHFISMTNNSVNTM